MKRHTSILLCLVLLLPCLAAAATLQLPKTGQTTKYADGDDGDLKKGTTWPTPRFTDNSNGTITDNLTGLIWLKNANCFGTQTWANALAAANSLKGDNTQCSLNDGSVAGDWRLPNRKELQSLIDRSQFYPALPVGHPFTAVRADYYGSSSTYAGDSTYAWFVFVLNGDVSKGNKDSNFLYVWPVRAGQ